MEPTLIATKRRSGLSEQRGAIMNDLEQWRESYRRAKVPIFCRVAGCRTRNADGFLYGPGDVLGEAPHVGALCAMHAAEIIEEFARKLGEQWTLVDPVEHFVSALAARKLAAIGEKVYAD